jgi:hypothetical protein
MRFWLVRVSVLLLCIIASRQFSTAQDTISLSWKYASTNELGFGIQRATSTNGPWTQIATIPAPTTSYLDTGLQYSTTYYYQIWAYDAAGNSPLSNIASFMTTLAPISRFSVSPAGQITLTVTGQIGQIYNIQASQDLKTWKTIGTVTILLGVSLDFTDTDAANYPRRFYRVQRVLP